MRQFLRTFFLFSLILLVGCEGNRTIVNNLEERDANEIIVFLAIKGIDAQKMQAATTGVSIGQANLYNISVDPKKATDAMALLTQYGLPRRQGTNLLELFPKSMMSTDREEAIRYNAGLAEQIRNTIRKMDGILDADVQISFPSGETTPGAAPQKMTAAVYVKHQGILEDPNSHIETKIKRLVSGSIGGLEYDNVAVISDRSRLASTPLQPEVEAISGKHYQQPYVTLWSIVMTQSSLTRFRLIFFSLIILILVMGGLLGWMTYRLYPTLFVKKKSDENPPS